MVRRKLLALLGKPRINSLRQAWRGVPCAFLLSPFFRSTPSTNVKITNLCLVPQTLSRWCRNDKNHQRVDGAQTAGTWKAFELWCQTGTYTPKYLATLDDRRVYGVENLEFGFFPSTGNSFTGSSELTNECTFSENKRVEGIAIKSIWHNLR